MFVWVLMMKHPAVTNTRRREVAEKKNMSARDTVFRVNYGSSVVSLPGVAAEKLPYASKTEILVLLAILGDNGVTTEQLSDICGGDEGEVRSALAFWRGAGVLEFGNISALAGKSPDPKQQTPSEKKPETEKISAQTIAKGKRPTSELPEYKMEEISQIIEDNADLGKMIDDCERILGRMFRVSETSHLLALVDQLGLSPEYVLLLCAHCARLKKTTVRYVETCAVGFHDQGIVTVEALEAHLHQLEKFDEILPEIRSLFGIKDRELTNREKGYFRNWILKYEYGMEVVRRACEIAVNAKGEASPAYVNGIIENWYAEELFTYEDVERKLNADRTARSNTAGQSFDVDDFFEAALRRSYGDSDFTPDVVRSGPSDGTKGKKKRK